MAPEPVAAAEPPPPTPEELLQRVRRATDELEQARAFMRQARSPEAALAFCKALQARRDAQARLPKLRLV